jgi:hypothetical protein
MLPWFCVHLPLQLRPGHSGGLICSVRAGCWKHVAILNMCQIQSDSGVDSVSLLLEEALSVVLVCERHLKTIYVILVCGSERRGQPS